MQYVKGALKRLFKGKEGIFVFGFNDSKEEENTESFSRGRGCYDLLEANRCSGIGFKP